MAALPQASAPGGLFDNPGAQMAETLDDDAEDVDDANGESVGDLGRKERAERRRMKNLFNEVVKTRYESVLREYLDAGFSADQFLVLPNSYYFERPADALRDIASHVGVDARDLDALVSSTAAGASSEDARRIESAARCYRVPPSVRVPSNAGCSSGRSGHVPWRTRGEISIKKSRREPHRGRRAPNLTRACRRHSANSVVCGPEIMGFFSRNPIGGFQPYGAQSSKSMEGSSIFYLGATSARGGG